jgi:uncharacterized protein (TIGR00255 family)
VVEGARLESVYAGNGIEGSNPSLSADHPIRQGRSVLRPSRFRTRASMPLTSMTGFGRGTATAGAATATAEVRTVNGRHLEVKTRLPRVLAGREADVERLVRTRLERGSVNVGVALEREAGTTTGVDAAAARRYAEVLRAVADAAGIEEPLRLDHLLRFPDVLAAEAPAAEADPDAWAAAEAALTAALDDLAVMRTQEGAALEADLRARLAALGRMTAEAEARAPQRLDEARTRLRARLDDLLGDNRVSPERLEQEIILLADRLDVTEECVRLRAHLQFFAEALDGADAPGRRLGFLVQEMNREVNTLGAKASDAALQHLAVAMKEELEKIREQVQNVE